MAEILVQGGFDTPGSSDIRFLQEAARLGPLQVLLLSDSVFRERNGELPRFPQEERRYVLEAVRYVHSVELVEEAPDLDSLSHGRFGARATWVVSERESNAGKRAFCRSHGLRLAVVEDSQVLGFPDHTTAEAPPASGARKRAFVTGCFDWLHSGHVRFFEEVSELGDLYVAVGNDESIRSLKGEAHPMYGQEERRYMVGAVRYVKKALITSGKGWMDSVAEIQQLKPDYWVVNEDGDRSEKREYCQKHGIEYRVLERLPREGLPARQSTELRGY